MILIDRLLRAFSPPIEIVLPPNSLSGSAETARPAPIATRPPRADLGPKQIAWLNDHVPQFNRAFVPAQRAREDSDRARAVYAQARIEGRAA